LSWAAGASAAEQCASESSRRRQQQAVRTARKMAAKQRVIEVDEAAAGMRLDRFLAAEVGSRARAEALIAAAQVLVDGELRPKSYPLRAGQRVRLDPLPAPEIAAEQEPTVPFAIVFEDEHLLVVDKPAGLVVHPARGHRTGTLAQALAGRAAGGEEPWRAGIVHRLDRDTSGLLVVTKSDEAHRTLKRLLAARALRREYAALTEGLPPARSGTIDAPIGPHRRDRTLVSVDTDHPREARTHFELEHAFARSALLRVVLETGRTHQIRVHLAAIGHPVLGDRQYGGAARYGLERQFLHARRLSFPHPISGAELDFASPLPADLARALELARAE
jgi:23S rRNA pseudouridine1911/1915/1917 synthase